MAEIWKAVPSYPGVLASDIGRVLLPPRSLPLPNGGYRLYVPWPVIGSVSRAKVGAAHSYRSIFSRDLGNLKVHQLICEAFHGPKPNPRCVVIHIDEDAHNNCADNLKWASQKENLNAPGFIVYCKKRTGDNNPTRKGKMTTDMRRAA